MCKELWALPKLYLFLDAVDLGSQPLDHPVHLGDFLFGVAEIIAVPAGCDLQLLILIESEQSESPCQNLGWVLSTCTAWPSGPPADPTIR